jgi:hypothetical protein
VATIESGKWAGLVPNLDCIDRRGTHEVLAEPAWLNRQPHDA